MDGVHRRDHLQRTAAVGKAENAARVGEVRREPNDGVGELVGVNGGLPAGNAPDRELPVDDDVSFGYPDLPKELGLFTDDGLDEIFGHLIHVDAIVAACSKAAREVATRNVSVEIGGTNAYVGELPT